jgi:hypothetical protein
VRHELAGKVNVYQVDRGGIKTQAIGRQQFPQPAEQPVGNEIIVLGSEDDIIEDDLLERKGRDPKGQDGNDATEQGAPQVIQMIPEAHLLFLPAVTLAFGFTTGLDYFAEFHYPSFKESQKYG